MYLGIICWESSPLESNGICILTSLAEYRWYNIADPYCVSKWFKLYKLYIIYFYFIIIIWFKQVLLCVKLMFKMNNILLFYSIMEYHQWNDHFDVQFESDVINQIENLIKSQFWYDYFWCMIQFNKNCQCLYAGIANKLKLNRNTYIICF